MGLRRRRGPRPNERAKRVSAVADAREAATAGEPRPARLRRIWLVADDYGISPAVNAAIRDLAMRGRLNATSVMVVAPSCTRPEVRSLGFLNAATERVAIGLHLTLTAPYRPLTQGFIPLRDGAFLPLPHLMREAFLRRLDRDLIAAEARAQLATFIGLFGQPPDFVDGHQHVHLLPKGAEASSPAFKDGAPHLRTPLWGAARTAGPPRGREGVLRWLPSPLFSSPPGPKKSPPIQLPPALTSPPPPPTPFSRPPSLL